MKEKEGKCNRNQSECCRLLNVSKYCNTQNPLGSWNQSFLHIHNTAIKNSIKTHSSAFWEMQSASVLKITCSHNATITLSDVMWKPRPLSGSSLLQERKQLLCSTSRKAFALVLASPADLLPQISSSWTREPLTGFLLDLQAELWLKQQDMSTFLYFLRLK